MRELMTLAGMREEFDLLLYLENQGIDTKNMSLSTLKDISKGIRELVSNLEPQ